MHLAEGIDYRRTDLLHRRSDTAGAAEGREVIFPQAVDARAGIIPPSLLHAGISAGAEEEEEEWAQHIPSTQSSTNKRDVSAAD